MGIVHQAKDIQLNRVVALKMIRDGLFASSEELARFRCEVETAARLEHPHIIRIYEYGEEKSEPYYAMELMAGSLDRHLSRGLSLSRKRLNWSLSWQGLSHSPMAKG